MSSSSPEQKSEARRALNVLSRNEQRLLIRELELDDGAIVFFLPPFGRVTLGNGALMGRADPQMRIMFLVIFGLLVILIMLLVVYIVTLFIGKIFDERLLTLMTAIIGYLAGVITPKPTFQERKEKSIEE